jgi:hypothetical protein
MTDPVTTTIDDAHAATTWQTAGRDYWIDRLNTVHPHLQVDLSHDRTGIDLDVRSTVSTFRSTIGLCWPVTLEDALETMRTEAADFDHQHADFVWFREWVTEAMRVARPGADPTTAILMFRLVITTSRGAFFDGSLAIVDGNEALVWPPDQGPWSPSEAAVRVEDSWTYRFHADGRLDVCLGLEETAKLLTDHSRAWLKPHREPTVVIVHTWDAPFRELCEVLEAT